MYSRSLLITAAAASLSLVMADGVDDPNAICYSYGVDFVDEGSYFINVGSTDDFSSVSYFKGCKKDAADVVLVAPDDSEVICDQIPTWPDEVHQLSKCPIEKDQMVSGHWILLILGNNGDGGQPFAWQRDLYLTVGTQVTSTYTPTVTVTTLTTPTQTQTTTSTLVDTITTGPFTTVTVPTGTASNFKTITPKVIYSTTTQTITRTRVSYTKSFHVTTTTIEANCANHPKQPDKPAQHIPTIIQAAALATPKAKPKFHRWVRKDDRPVDYEWARQRFEAAKERRDGHKVTSHHRRDADYPTTTITLNTPVTVNATVTAPAVTTTETVLATTTTTTTLPPVTIPAGLITRTTTLPVSTKTFTRLTSTTTTTTSTIQITYTKTTTVTRPAPAPACTRANSHRN